MKKLLLITILSCNFLNAQNVFPTTGNVGIGTINPTNSLSIIKSPTANDAHIFFGEASAAAGQASAKLTFAGLGINMPDFHGFPVRQLITENYIFLLEILTMEWIIL